MPVSRRTAYEMLNEDVQVFAGGLETKSGKYAGFITRGPECNCRILVSTNPKFDTMDSAQAEMQKVLDAGREWAKKDLDDPRKLFHTPIAEAPGEIPRQ